MFVYIYNFRNMKMQMVGQGQGQCNNKQNQIKNMQSYITVKNRKQEQKIMKNKSKLNKDKKGDQYQNYEVCTRYQQCIDIKNKIKDQNFHQNFHQKLQQNTFQIPQSLLQQQKPQIINKLPTQQIGVNSCNITNLLHQNISKHKHKQIQLKQQKQRQLRIKQKKIDKIINEAKNISKSCKKIKFDDINKCKWNHSLFNATQKNNDQGSCKQQGQQAQKSKQKSKQRGKSQTCKQKQKLQLKPIKQRIIQYKKNQNQIQKKYEQKEKCNHDMLCKHNKNIKTVNSQIQRRAQEYIQNQKQKAKNEQNKKTEIKAKIKAIQIQSLQSLHKFKKKSVDSTIQFCVPLNQKQQQKNRIINTNQSMMKKQQQQLITQRAKNKNNKYNKKYKSFIKTQKTAINSSKQLNKNKQKTSIMSQQTYNTKNINMHTNTNININTNSIEHQNINNQNDKFYIWNIPITRKDFDVIFTDNQAPPRQKAQNSTSASTSTFRQEVNQFLQQQTRRNIKQYIKYQKLDKFNNLVKSKKEQFLAQFDHSYGSGSGLVGQIFWGQDQLIKISNNFKPELL